jgi:putative hemolysin
MPLKDLTGEFTMICIETVIEQRLPGFTERRPLLGKTLVSLLRYLWHETEFKQFSQQYPHLEGFDFIEQVFDYFDFSYRVKDSEKTRITERGKVVIVANHPIGSLDGLALLKMVGEIRPDVKVVANELLSAVTPLGCLLLPVDNMNGHTGRGQLRAIRDQLDQDGAVIMFPAGEVSRVSPTGIKDGCWNSGFLRIANSKNAPILPVCVDGRNSILFYSISLLAKPISTLWLIREMFKQAKHHVDISVGHMVYPEQYQRLELKPDAVAKLFKKHVYRLPKRNKRQLGFVAEFEAVAHPENSQRLKREIQHCERLGETADGKAIVLYRYQTNSVLMREIGRLRELTFRAVKEGTGKRRDTDSYDHYYDHLVLWDDQELEVVGAYRLARSRQVLNAREQGLYTQTLFDYSEAFNPYFDQGLELGRSFVQPKYWGKRSLDYLWQGIGVYLKKYPQIRYLFGPVSISHDYPDTAKAMLVQFYSLYYPASTTLATAKTPYRTAAKYGISHPLDLAGNDYKMDFALLKHAMSEQGVAVPTLYKQYTEFCEPGGVAFLGFNIDSEFANCIDGLIVVDLHTIKASKRQRYMAD